MRCWSRGGSPAGGSGIRCRTGDALLFGRLSVLLYALATWVATAAFVRWYEEPALARRFGPDYAAYQQAVRAWWPRLRPYRAS